MYMYYNTNLGRSQMENKMSPEVIFQQQKKADLYPVHNSNLYTVDWVFFGSSYFWEFSGFFGNCYFPKYFQITGFTVQQRQRMPMKS